MKVNLNSIGLLLLLFLFVWGCKKKTPELSAPKTVKTVEKDNVTGNYVSESYSKRDEGYDWVSVSVAALNNDQLRIAIRSRADKKNPTCTFDAIANKVDTQNYQAQINDNVVSFKFSNNSVHIFMEKEEEGLLYFYCSGGASIGGTYSKINEKLDQHQIDKTQFNQVLNLQDVGFNVSTIEKNNTNTLTIFTFGLQEVEYNETFNIEGEKVISAAVEDLNSDGSPELFVFTQSEGSGSYGNVYAFSVNNKKSMSPVYFKPTAENSEINNGYMGHDTFSLIENTLGQRFPIYSEGDTNANPTGGTRQISYKLVEGESGRKLEIYTITEF